MPHILTPAEAHETLKARRRHRRQRLYYFEGEDKQPSVSLDLADDQAEIENIIRGMLSGRGQ